MDRGIPFATVPVTLIKEMLHKNMGAFWLLTGCLFWVWGFNIDTYCIVLANEIPYSCFLSFICIIPKVKDISICLLDAVGSNLSDGWFFLIPCDSIGIFHFGHVIDHPCVFQGQCWRHACLASKGLKMMLGFTSFPLA